MSIETLKQALEALETGWPVVADVFRVDHVMKYEAAITALRTAIEQAERVEPVAFNVGVPPLYPEIKDGETISVEYTTPPAQEFVCSTGLCHFTLTQTNVGIGERGMEAYEEAKKRGWVGVSDERLMEMPKQEPLAWKNAAIRLGEELSSVGPDGYYNMTAEQWLDWAMDQRPRGKNSLPAAQPAPVQEPVAWMYKVNGAHTCFDLFEPPDDAYDEGTLHPLYTTPPAAPVQEPDKHLQLALEALAPLEKLLVQADEQGLLNGANVDCQIATIELRKSAYAASDIRAYLNTTPPAAQRQWIGLTEEEHTQIAVDAGCMSSDWVFYGAAVERALRKKNGGQA